MSAFVRTDVVGLARLCNQIKPILRLKHSQGNKAILLAMVLISVRDNGPALTVDTLSSGLAFYDILQRAFELPGKT